MEDLVTDAPWASRTAFVTGHTGFTGSWLALWLQQLGVRVYGYSLSPPTDPSLFDIANVSQALQSDTRGDVRDPVALASALKAAAPDIVFHLAAQPLVLESYKTPLETIATNVMGTANVLDAIRHTDSVQAAIVVTSDKCYDNPSHGQPFQESDNLGGHDPYSASKACAELVSAAYRSSFFSSSSGAAVASTRAGNIVGGGDWAEERLIPDCVRAALLQTPVVLRRPKAVRPWQHVLDAVKGYLKLGEKLLGNDGKDYAAAWNLGPDAESSLNVAEVAQLITKKLGGSVIEDSASSTLQEAELLLLDSSRARSQLGWLPNWTLAQTLDETAAWYRAWIEEEDMANFTLAQLARYTSDELK